MPRLRDHDRQYRFNPGDAYGHARLLRLLLASGEINEVAIELAAFLGHPACVALLNVDKVKPAGVIKDDSLIKNLDIRDYILNLQEWGFAVVYLAAAGLFRLVAKDIARVVDRNDLLLAANLINKFVRDRTLKDSIKNFKRSTDSFLSAGGRWAHSERKRLSRIDWTFSSIMKAISRAENCILSVKSISVYYEDEDVKEAIRNEIYPFILGEYA